MSFNDGDRIDFFSKDVKLCKYVNGKFGKQIVNLTYRSSMANSVIRLAGGFEIALAL